MVCALQQRAPRPAKEPANLARQSALFPQSRQELHQITGPGAGIQLGADQAIPGGGYRVEGAGQHEDQGAVGYPGQTATLQAAGAYRLVGEHPKQFAKTVDCLIEQRCHRLGGAIAAGEAGAAAADHNLYCGISDPAADFGANLIAVIGHQPPLHQPVTRRLQQLLQGVAAAVFGGGAGI